MKVDLLPIGAANNIAAEPTSCPGFACPKKSDACETCGLSEDSLFVVWFNELIGAVRKMYIGPHGQSRNDGLYDLQLAATMARGSRASAECCSGRIRF